MYLEKAHSLLGGQGQPLIQAGGGSGVSPARTGPHRQGPQGRAEVTQAQRQTPFQDPAPESQRGPCSLSSSLPSRPKRKQVVMAFVTMLPAGPESLKACPQVARGCHWKGGWKETLCQRSQSLIISAPSNSSPFSLLPPSRSPPARSRPYRAHRCGQSLARPAFAEDPQGCWGIQEDLGNSRGKMQE